MLTNGIKILLILLLMSCATIKKQEVNGPDNTAGGHLAPIGNVAPAPDEPHR